jgi:hypothetical protein
MHLRFSQDWENTTALSNIRMIKTSEEQCARSTNVSHKEIKMEQDSVVSTTATCLANMLMHNSSLAIFFIVVAL